MDGLAVRKKKKKKRRDEVEVTARRKKKKKKKKKKKRDVDGDALSALGHDFTPPDKKGKIYVTETGQRVRVILPDLKRMARMRRQGKIVNHTPLAVSAATPPRRIERYSDTRFASGYDREIERQSMGVVDATPAIDSELRDLKLRKSDVKRMARAAFSTTDRLDPEIAAIARQQIMEQRGG